MKYPIIDTEHYGLAHVINGDTLILRCLKCSALVDAEYQTDHDEWHEKLRRAVDEAETLG